MSLRIQHVVASLRNLGSHNRGSDKPQKRALPWLLIGSLFIACPLGRVIAEPLHLAQLDHASWTGRDGAPANIQGIYQDLDGTLWLWSDSGLFVFDGKVFSLFQPPPSEPQLPSPPIISAYMAKDGTLWVGYAFGVIAAIRNHHVVRLYDDQSGLPVGAVSQILAGPENKVMVIARDRLFQLEGVRWKDLTARYPLGGEQIRLCFFDHRKTIWIVTLKSVWKMTASGKQFVKTGERGGLQPSFTESSDGVLWLAINGAPDKTVLHRIPEDGGPAVSREFPFLMGPIFVDPYNYLWLLTNFGIVRIDPDHWPTMDPHLWEKAEVRDSIHQKKLLLEKYDNRDGLTGDLAVDVLRDNLGDFWVSTTNGLDRFVSPPLTRLLDERISVRSAVTQCSKGDVWVANYSDLLSVHDGLISGRRPAEAFFAYCDHEGAIWLSGSGGLFKYDKSGTKFFAPPAGVPAINNRQVVGRNSHQLFVSYTRNGIWRFADGSWFRIRAPGFPDETAMSLLLDSKDRLWAGFLGSRIAVLEGKTGRTFKADSSTALGPIQVLLESRYGMAVGGMSGIGLLRGDHLQTLFVVDPSAVQGVSGLLESATGDLWLNTLHGITRIPAGELVEAVRAPSYHMHAERYSEPGTFGPAPQLFDLPSAVVDSHGVFWFATSRAVSSVDPSSIHPSSTAPILSGISMTVDGTPPQADRRLAPGYHTYRIRYLGAYLKAPEKVTYRYKLDGADSEWQDVGDRSEGVYTGLRPGTYQFWVAASNGEGVWSKPDASLKFTVLPFFYQTPLFAFLSLGALIGILWFGYLLRIRRVAGAIRQREEVRADERIRIARDLHDTLLQGMQGLTLRFSVAAKQLPQGSQARESLENALSSADRLLNEGRNRVGRLRAGDLTSDNLINGFKALAAELNDQERVQFELNCDGPLSKIKPRVLGELYYIGCEAISNAFRHSHATEITVRLQCLPKTLILAVSDSGVGFDWDAHKRNPATNHWGLHGMRERAQLLDAILEFSGSANVGTQILVAVPARRAYKKG